MEMKPFAKSQVIFWISKDRVWTAVVVSSVTGPGWRNTWFRQEGTTQDQQCIELKTHEQLDPVVLFSTKAEAVSVLERRLLHEVATLQTQIEAATQRQATIIALIERSNEGNE